MSSARRAVRLLLALLLTSCAAPEAAALGDDCQEPGHVVPGSSVSAGRGRAVGIGLAGRPVRQFTLTWPDRRRLVTFVANGLDLARVIFDPDAPLNHDILATVRFDFVVT